jgi:tetratricopeptide (TPR) repeat protein
MKKNPIEDALGLRPLEEALREESPERFENSDNLPIAHEIPTTELAIPQNSLDLLAKAESDETLQDIEKARKNIEKIIELGGESLDEMISLAKQSESPRAFEVASTLMKTLLDANKDFVEMSTRKKYAKDEILNPKEEEVAQTNITNNNLILSTADLLKMIKGDV